MDEIVPHLYIGSLPTCLEMTSLRQSHIKSIVSCMYDPPSLPESYDIKDENLLNVPVDDVEDIPIFLYFGQCCRFLEQRLHDSNEASNGSVLVYCQAGSSRSVTIVAAYLMKARQWTVEQALSFMKSKRKEADPNPGFLQQLALFEAEGYQVRLPRPQVRRFLIQHTNAMDTLLTPTMLIQKGKDAGDDDPYSDPVDAASQTTSSSTSSARLRCKMCRRELASAEHVVPHDPGKGEMAFEPNKRDSVRKGVTPAPQAGMRALPQVPVLPPQLARARQALAGPTMRQSLLHSPRCSAYFVEPLTWMMDSSDVVEGVISGRLICPNDKCQAKLGSWTWAGTQCACGAWVTPAFGLQRAKVDEVFVS